MPTIKVKGDYFLHKGKKGPEAKFRPQLSINIIEKFGIGPFDENTATNIIRFCVEHFVSHFQVECKKESSIRFYQYVFWLHEQATDLVYQFPHQDLSDDFSANHVAEYRRVLKFILEVGCEVHMTSGEEIGQDFKKRADELLDDLLFWGHMVLLCTDLYAEQSMVEDLIDTAFDDQGHYVLKRRHHYDHIFEYVQKHHLAGLTDSVIDDYGIDDLKIALESCLGIKYDEVGSLIGTIHGNMAEKGGEIVGVGWETLTRNMHEIFNTPLDVSEQFFRGLRLDKFNKLDLLELAYKPYRLKRYLYRPIIIWNVDGNDYAWFGKKSWTESIIRSRTIRYLGAKPPKNG